MRESFKTNEKSEQEPVNNKESSEQFKPPIRLLEAAEGLQSANKLSTVYEKAIQKWQEYRRLEEKHGLRQHHLKLLADAENPFRLEEFSRDEKLLLNEILSRISKE